MATTVESEMAQREAGAERLWRGKRNDRLSGEELGRPCRDLKPPTHPGHQGGGAKLEEVAKQEVSDESAATSKESSDVPSSASLCHCRRGIDSRKTEESVMLAGRINKYRGRG